MELRRTMMGGVPISLALLTAFLICHQPMLSSAQPLSGVLDGARDVVSHVGQTVGDTVGSTAEAVGKGVESASDRVSGNVDVKSARAEIDSMASKSLSKLFKLDKKAKTLFDRSYGYAVFDSRKTSFLFTVGRGAGVAVNKQTSRRTYMQMLAGGANLGAGIKYFQNIFLFENKDAFEQFVNVGFEAGSTASGVFGRDSLQADVRFTNGMAVFQLSDTGIMLAADVTGTKYWKDSALN